MNRRKEQVNATVSPLTDRQIDALVGSHQLFSSRSDVIDKAVGFLFYAMNSASMCACAEDYGLTLEPNVAGHSPMVVPA